MTAKTTNMPTIIKMVQKQPSALPLKSALRRAFFCSDVRGLRLFGLDAYKKLPHLRQTLFPWGLSVPHLLHFMQNLQGTAKLSAIIIYTPGRTTFQGRNAFTSASTWGLCRVFRRASSAARQGEDLSAANGTLPHQLGGFAGYSTEQVPQPTGRGLVCSERNTLPHPLGGFAGYSTEQVPQPTGRGLVCSERNAGQALIDRLCRRVID
jgi:hypothetical protein